MSIFTDFSTEALADDGTWGTFLAHKAVHVCVGALVALTVLHLPIPHQLVVACVSALVVGIVRELEKTTGMLLHIVTALITASGAGIAVFMSTQPNTIQIIIAGCMVLYSAIVTVLQLKANGTI